uniref:Uncharacterized protein n=1 Tax=Glossina brevipalpis TaxID=37001 RepID=A0A1A9X2E9_9MUSC
MNLFVCKHTSSPTSGFPCDRSSLADYIGNWERETLKLISLKVGPFNCFLLPDRILQLPLKGQSFKMYGMVFRNNHFSNFQTALINCIRKDLQKYLLHNKAGLLALRVAQRVTNFVVTSSTVWTTTPPSPASSILKASPSAHSGHC